MTKKIKFLCLALLIPIIASCSGGGGSASEDSPRENESDENYDNELPAAQILFPRTEGLWTDREQIVVRGTSTDNRGIAGVVVNGIEAKSSDRFATWTAEVPLLAGQFSEIIVEVTDTSGNTAPNAARTTVNTYNHFNSYRFCSPIAYDSIGGAAYRFDPPLALNLASGDELPLRGDFSDVTGAAFDPGSGRYLLIKDDNLLSFDSEFANPVVVSPSTSPSFGTEPQISIDASTGMIYVMEWWASSVVAVDPTTGKRTYLGSWKDSAGNKVSSFTPGFQVVGGRFFVSTLTALYELDLTDSTVTELSGPAVGSGPELNHTAGLSVDLTEGIAYIGDLYNQLLAINLSTGHRKVISSGSSGAPNNQIFEWARYGFSDAGSSILVNSCLSGHTIAINKQTGQRRQVSPTTRGVGPVFTELQEIHFDEFTGELIAINEIYRSGRDLLQYNNAYAQQLISVKPETGDRKVLSTPFGASEPLMGEIAHIESNPNDGTIFASLNESGSHSIQSLSRETGKWQKILDVSEGGDSNIRSIFVFSFDRKRNSLLVIADVVDEGICLLRIDPISGNRTLGACLENSDQFPFSFLDMVVDSNVDRAYLTDGVGGILAVNLETGNIELHSGRGVGAGPELIDLGQLTLDAENSRLLVDNYLGKDPDTGKTQTELMAIDLNTGDRSSLIKLSKKKNEYLKISPAVDPETGEAYLGLPNRAVAVLDSETNQYLMISQ